MSATGASSAVGWATTGDDCAIGPGVTGGFSAVGAASTGEISFTVGWGTTGGSTTGTAEGNTTGSSAVGAASGSGAGVVVGGSCTTVGAVDAGALDPALGNVGGALAAGTGVRNATGDSLSTVTTGSSWTGVAVGVCCGAV